MLSQCSVRREALGIVDDDHSRHVRSKVVVDSLVPQLLAPHDDGRNNALDGILCCGHRHASLILEPFLVLARPGVHPGLSTVGTEVVRLG